MALIKCPECEKQVSDRAVTCPNCGCPISNFSKIPTRNNGLVRIKLEPTPGVISQKVSIRGCGITWTGQTGKVAEIQINCSGTIKVLYHSTLSVGDGSCEVSVNPALNNTFIVRPRPVLARLRTKLDIQRVDYLT